MKSLFVPVVLLSCAVAASAQTPATPAAAPASPVVATVNGQPITRAELDAAWERLGTKMRDQYEKNGGKPALLENYLRKRLVVQEALKAGFDKNPGVQADMAAAAEGALFDRYIRDVVAGQIVTDDMVRKYYDEHKAEFATPEAVKARHIVITPNGAGPRPKTDEEAQKLIRTVQGDLQKAIAADPKNAESIFAAAAAKYSEDGVAQQGGELGWATKGMLDPAFEEVAFKTPDGTMSGIVKTKFGYHLIFTEAHRPAGTQPFAEARSSIREFLLSEHGAEIMTAVSKLTNSLRLNSQVVMHPENID